MSSTDETRPARGRVARAQEDQQRRRRREGNDTNLRRRLALPEEKLDRTTYQYRWVNDTPGRIDMLYSQDWDLVGNEELGSGGYTVDRHGDVAPNRIALTSRLMRKPVELYQADHAVRQNALDEEMQAAELGRKVVNGPDAEGAEVGGQGRLYTPRDTANKL